MLFTMMLLVDQGVWLSGGRMVEVSIGIIDRVFIHVDELSINGEKLGALWSD